MNRQEAFDKALKALLEQGTGTYDKELLQCMYDSPEGNRCAVGHLFEEVPDSIKKEEDPVDVLITTYPKECVHFSGLGKDFLLGLQSAHDEAAKFEDDFKLAFKDNMKRLALKRGLKYDEEV